MSCSDLERARECEESNYKRRGSSGRGRESVKRASTSVEAPACIYILERESVKRANPRKHFDQSKNPPRTNYAQV